MTQIPARPLPREDVAAAFPVILSGLLPGLGQMYARRWGRGLLLLSAPLLGLLALGILLAAAAPGVTIVVRNIGLFAVLLVGALFAYHVAVVVDAYAGGRKRVLDAAVLVAVIGALALGYLSVYREVRGVGSVIAAVFERPGGRTVTPGSASAGTTAPAWSGTERLNILLLGVDTRDDAQTQNTDTMIVLSVDPATRTGAMLSIPRDTLVEIPGKGLDKVNAAYVYGGGGAKGAELARVTVERFLGISIHSYAVIDFAAFRETVDSTGGVLVDVGRPLRDELYPTADAGVQRIAFEAGPQTMDGERALQYARSRHSTNDFSRAQRQQQIVFALRARFAELGLLRLPAIAQSVGPLVRTDFDPAQVLPLARLVLGIARSAIRSEVLLPCDIEAPHCELAEQNAPSGYYLIPDQKKVRALVESLFSAQPASSR